MQPFLADHFAELHLLLGRISGTSHVMSQLGQGRNASVSGENKTQFMNETLPHIERILRQTGLSLSLAQVQRIRTQLLDGDVTSDDLHARVVQLQERIQDELTQQLLLQIPEDKAHFYRDPLLFGQQVDSSFPSAHFDIEEAGKCLALARSTACVMHLSRAVEVALKALADVLGLPSRNDWGRHINDIEKELERRYKSSGARSNDEMFYSETVAQIGHIKTAWRNPTMHVDRVYTEEIAQDIFLAIGAFMKHVATKLHE